MEEYSIRVLQLKKFKARCLLKISALIFVWLIAETGIFYLYRFVRGRYQWEILSAASDAELPLLRIGYFLIMTLLLIGTAIGYFRHENRLYQRKYSEYLFSECKLEEIFILEHKIRRSDERNRYMMNLFDLSSLHFLKSYSDASSKFSMDISTIRYKKKKKKHIGTILSVHFDQERPGFLQLCTTDYVPFQDFNGIPVGKYGFSFRSNLKNYHMFSTYGSRSYQLEDARYGRCILNLESFFRQRIYLVFDNDSLYLFLQDVRIRFVDGLLRPVSHTAFDDKMQSIKTLHRLCFELISIFDDIFVTKF